MECHSCKHEKRDRYVRYCELTGRNVVEHEDECVNREVKNGKNTKI